jgi:hypothetical protein
MFKIDQFLLLVDKRKRKNAPPQFRHTNKSHEVPPSVILYVAYKYIKKNPSLSHPLYQDISLSPLSATFQGSTTKSFAARFLSL